MASSFSNISRRLGPARNSPSSVRRLSAVLKDSKADHGSAEAGATSALKGLEGKLEEIQQWRRQRQRFFASELFADPAWDILLALALAELQFRRMSVGRLCDASNVPTSTAIRWVKHLEDQGYIVRFPDKFDGRRSYIELSDSASEAMKLYLESLIGENSSDD